MILITQIDTAILKEYIDGLHNLGVSMWIVYTVRKRWDVRLLRDVF